ncbi:type II secretion system F family protein [Nanoarchaeota archaeon]
MYRYIATHIPKNLKEKYIQLLRYSDVQDNPLKFIGFVILNGFLLSIVFGFVLNIFYDIPLYLTIPIAFIAIQLLVYFILMLKADKKAKFVENILPDVLQLMASNLRAGYTTDRALLLSARSEFGVFQKEINQVGKEITTGSEIEDALKGMTKRIKSERLSKTISLIVSGLSSGGELALLLEQTARNLRHEILMDKRIRANVMMYVIFISVAVIIGAPLLFGLSSFFVEIFAINVGSVEIPEAFASSLPFSYGNVSITLEFVILFSVIYLITASIFGSLIISLISKGREREGIKYMPLFIGISLIVFFIIRLAIKSMLSRFFGT